MPTPTNQPPLDRSPLEDWLPLEPHEHEAQLIGLEGMLPAPSRVIDLGAGDGRIGVPLAELGHEVVGVERDRAAIEALAARTNEIEIIEGDFLEPGCLGALEAGSFDLAICLGHTFMQVVEPGRAVDLLSELDRILAPHGSLVIDAMCEPLWKEVASGRWQSGLSEDGTMQLVWSAGDNVLALRQKEAIDPECWMVREGDRALRLWSMGELELLTRAVGWEAPRTKSSAHLIVLTRCSTD